MEDINETIRRNLLRLMKESGFTKQNEFARHVGVDEVYINAVLKERRGMGKDVMERICKALNIESWQFHMTERTPIVRNEKELQAIEIIRTAEAEGTHVAEDVLRYGRFRVNEAKQTPGVGGPGKGAGASGRKRRAG